MKKSSLALMSSLLLTSTIIVNCQKAPEKRKVRPGTDTVSPAAKADDVKIIPSKVCTTEIKDLYEKLGADWAVVSDKIEKTKPMTDVVKNEIKEIRLKMADNCKIVIGLLDKEENKSCLKDEKERSEKNSIYKDRVETQCQNVGHVLERDHGVRNELGDQYNESQKLKLDKEKLEEIKKSNLELSKEAEELVKIENVDWEMFLADGKIKKGQQELQASLKANETVCSFVDFTLNREDNDKVVLKILDQTEEKDAKKLPKDFKGKNVVFQIERLHDLSSEDAIKADLLKLTCISAESKSITAEQLKKAFGSHILTTSYNTESGAETQVESTEAESTEARATDVSEAAVSSTTVVSETDVASANTVVTTSGTSSTPSVSSTEAVVTTEVSSAASGASTTKAVEAKTADGQAHSEKLEADKKASEEELQKYAKAVKAARAKAIIKLK